MVIAEKSCIKCCVTKPLSEFYRHSRMADGHLNKCKECTKADVASNRLSKITYYREYDRGRSSAPHRVSARKRYSESPKGKEAGVRARRAYDERNPNQRTATVALNNAVRDRRINRLPCEVCGDGRSEAHHAAYDLPLVVTWLCDRHHKQLHKEFRELQRAQA